MDLLEALRVEAAAFAEAVRAGDLDAPVPVCGPWTLRELAGHLGRVHRWAAGVVRTGKPSRESAEAPVDDELVGWLEQGAADLLAALAEHPAREVWSLVGPRPASWWTRRQALETALHRVDAERSSGPSRPIDPALAVHGVDEVVEDLLPRQLARGRRPPTEVALALVDTSGSQWRLEGPAPAVRVEAPADLLLLLLWGRADLDEPGLLLEGERRLAERVLTALTP